MEWMEPMEPILLETVIKGGDWVHQIKWDGIRGLCYVEQGRTRLFTRSGRERIAWYPEVANINSMLNCNEAVLDGELIVLNEEGRPSFYHVMARERVKRQERVVHYREKYPVQYMVFDILYRDGVDLREEPLKERKTILEKTLKGDGMIQVVSDYWDGEGLLYAMKEKRMEGIVSKQTSSRYSNGKKHRAWFKTKIKKRLLCVVCGVKLKEGEIKSLVLGISQNGRLIPVGNVSSGLSYKDKTLLAQALSQLQQKESPFGEEIKEKDVIWFQPVLTVQVVFMEREPQGGLRHPVLEGFSAKKPDEATGEEEIV
ncbi:MAG: non-homologous end-joining DNA ligase [Thermoclostridium sp.]|nr:non-homologous end-joining DNA ligase [Thermoclostridium sp.]